ncbi:hypothetical protein BC829DRAFT_420386 [Chytridium lagenaria]|nr:hypothetical protein BC829DRAFT_420386 [Chytridium lagenaria]
MEKDTPVGRYLVDELQRSNKRQEDKGVLTKLVVTKRNHQVSWTAGRPLWMFVVKVALKKKASDGFSVVKRGVKDEVPKSGIRGGILSSVGDRGNGFIVIRWRSRGRSHWDKSIMSDTSRRRVAAEALVSLVKERGLRDEDEGPERRWRYWRRYHLTRDRKGYLARIRMVFVITDGSNGCGGGVGARLTIDINDRPLISTYEGMVGREANLNAGAARKGLSHCWYQRWRRWRRRRGSLQDESGIRVGILVLKQSDGGLASTKERLKLRGTVDKQLPNPTNGFVEVFTTIVDKGSEGNKLLITAFQTLDERENGINVISIAAGFFLAGDEESSGYGDGGASREAAGAFGRTVTKVRGLRQPSRRWWMA